MARVLPTDLAPEWFEVVAAAIVADYGYNPTARFLAERVRRAVRGEETLTTDELRAFGYLCWIVEQDRDADRDAQGYAHEIEAHLPAEIIPMDEDEWIGYTERGPVE